MEGSPRSLERRVRQHVIAKEHVFFAVVQPGFEPAAADELRELGIKITEAVEGGIEFTGKLDSCYRVNLASRTVTRVLLRVSVFHAENERVLARKIAAVPWELYLPNNVNLVFKASSSGSRLYHTGLIEESVSKGIRERCNSFNMGPVDAGSRSQRIHVRITDNLCTVSLDTSGEPLYRRGRKRYVSDAPLRETLASLILREAAFSDYPVLFDPMCGSGTFSIEAAESSDGILAGTTRDFAFACWPSFRETAFNHLKKNLVHVNARTFPEKIICWDHDADAVRTAAQNIAEAGLENRITVELKDFLHDTPDLPFGKPVLIVMNPPYGHRLDDGKTATLYRQIGDVMRKRYTHAGFAIIAPGEQMERELGLKWDKKILFFNGGIPVGLLLRRNRPHR